MSYNLFLDDVRVPQQVTWAAIPLVEWEIVRSYDEFVKKVEEKGLPNFVTFDHDLAQEHYPFFNAEKGNMPEIDYASYKERTGYDCARFLVAYCLERGLRLPPFTCHSLNPVGRENIIAYLNNAKVVLDKKAKNQ
jgi:hypothetical protein